ncbi:MULTISPECIES: site-specific integrase [Pseudomonas syringae group]|uniref:Integrase n=2 Tax=Pseudomonas syringae group TaxID=136849 RepID=A0A2K4WP96_PSESX|nr:MULTISPECIES: site-specific integrase [Pseudomonas syringae group]AVB16688.1 integrase [Pseudomonas amygdali pv. morsprunorum]KWS60304.1 integrase [Pseudomonas amygdali pv. morsprunorum]KWS65999.1 integrase [Pseudomonas amygdali pv. morsprunorum]MDT3225816.1 site-specific integrase [Pseudomonas amygdali pv. morsprunorum]PHX33920.1 integrase [Pseudomonas amygdali pv. morsprunorum]
MTEKPAITSQPLGSLTLPHTVKALSGAVFDPRTKRWTFHDGLHSISVNFERLRECATDELIAAAKFPLMWYAENAEAMTVVNLFDHFRRLLESISAAQGRPVSIIDALPLASFRASLTKETEWKLGALSAFFKKWEGLGVLGVTKSAVHFLKSIRFKGNRKGTAVLTMDPLKGPLTEIERSATQVALDDAFAARTIALDDYLLAWLCLLLGQRNIQYAMLKVGDVREITKADGATEYVLRVPRVKQGRAEARREQFKERLITPSIGKMLIDYASSVRTRFGDGDEFTIGPSQAPLFPQKKTTKKVRPGFQQHTSPKEIGNRVRSVFEALRVYSERTGEHIKITSKRLRHTVATSAAREGHGELIIAELLDHSDTQNVGIYVKATPEIIERIDRAVALRMDPLAHAFAGAVIISESAAIRGDDPTSRIVDPRFDETMKPMGNCGRDGPCGFMGHLRIKPDEVLFPED